MKILIIIVALMIGFGAGLAAPVVLADWEPGENQRLFEHVARAAEMIYNADIWGQKLSAIATAENIGGDPNFIDVPPWTKAEVLSMKAFLDDLHIFIYGGAALADEDRSPAMLQMLLGLQ